MSAYYCQHSIRVTLLAKTPQLVEREASRALVSAGPVLHHAAQVGEGQMVEELMISRWVQTVQCCHT